MARERFEEADRIEIDILSKLPLAGLCQVARGANMLPEGRGTIKNIQLVAIDKIDEYRAQLRELIEEN